jgi:hypothetical protein
VAEIGYFNSADRWREKQEARDHDERLIASGQAAPQQIAEKNGLFSAFDPSQAKLVHRRIEIHLG